VPSNEWGTDAQVERYLSRADEFPHRLEADAALLEQVPVNARRVLDLGTGDGRVLGLLRERADIVGVGLDASEPMLEAAAERFRDVDSIELRAHDMDDPLPGDLGKFEVVVSSFAIHHLEHERKRALYGEVMDLLQPGGAFVNLEHVSSPTRRLHEAFFEAIGERIEDEDPSDRLLDVETQVRWLRELGFEEADCFWKWREMAVFGGWKPSAA